MSKQQRGYRVLKVLSKAVQEVPQSVRAEVAPPLRSNGPLLPHLVRDGMARHVSSVHVVHFSQQHTAARCV